MFQLKKLKKDLKKEFNNILHFYFEVHLVEHCNLGCASCTHFSPVAEPEYLEESVLIGDLLRMRKLFGKNYPFYVRLLGGEPLLHPQINDLLQKTRESLPKARIELVTNGLRLLDMPDVFFRTVAEDSIVVYVSRYPMKFNYQKVFDLMDRWNISYVRNEHGDKQKFGKLPLSLDQKQNVWTSFKECIHADREHNLSHGKIYTCMYAANIRHFNKHFFQTLPEDNGIDIYKVKTAWEIRKKLKCPTPLCAFCRPQKDIMFPWHLSEQNISEWT